MQVFSQKGHTDESKKARGEKLGVQPLTTKTSGKKLWACEQGRIKRGRGPPRVRLHATKKPNVSKGGEGFWNPEGKSKKNKQNSTKKGTGEGAGTKRKDLKDQGMKKNGNGKKNKGKDRTSL